MSCPQLYPRPGLPLPLLYPRSGLSPAALPSVWSGVSGLPSVWSGVSGLPLVRCHAPRARLAPVVMVSGGVLSHQLCAGHATGTVLATHFTQSGHVSMDCSLALSSELYRQRPMVLLRLAVLDQRKKSAFLLRACSRWRG